MLTWKMKVSNKQQQNFVYNICLFYKIYKLNCKKLFGVLIFWLMWLFV